VHRPDRDDDRLSLGCQPVATVCRRDPVADALAFLFSTARNSREVADVVALVLGLLLIRGVADAQRSISSSAVWLPHIAYGVHRWKARA